MPKILATCIALAAFSACAAPNVQGVARFYDLSSDAIAIDGYDPVAYFRENRAVEGTDEHTYAFQQVVYRFASKENRDAFAQDPAAFVPAWGGWCAYAVAGEGTFFADPESFIVRDGRLFLFHDSIFFDAKKAWLKNDHDVQVHNGDSYWQRLITSKD